MVFKLTPTRRASALNMVLCFRNIPNADFNADFYKGRMAEGANATLKVPAQFTKTQAHVAYTFKARNRRFFGSWYSFSALLFLPQPQ